LDECPGKIGPNAGAFFDPAWNENDEIWYEYLPYNLPQENGIYNFYAMAAGSLKPPGQDKQNAAKLDVKSSPPPDLMTQYLWSRGVSQYNVFNARGGWSERSNEALKELAIENTLLRGKFQWGYQLAIPSPHLRVESSVCFSPVQLGTLEGSRVLRITLVLQASASPPANRVQRNFGQCSSPPAATQQWTLQSRQSFQLANKVSLTADDPRCFIFLVAVDAANTMYSLNVNYRIAEGADVFLYQATDAVNSLFWIEPALGPTGQWTEVVDSGHPRNAAAAHAHDYPHVPQLF
jgi:hypothetical protein